MRAMNGTVYLSNGLKVPREQVEGEIRADIERLKSLAHDFNTIAGYFMAEAAYHRAKIAVAEAELKEFDAEDPCRAKAAVLRAEADAYEAKAGFGPALERLSNLTSDLGRLMALMFDYYRNHIVSPEVMLRLAQEESELEKHGGRAEFFTSYEADDYGTLVELEPAS